MFLIGHHFSERNLVPLVLCRLFWHSLDVVLHLWEHLVRLTNYEVEPFGCVHKLTYHYACHGYSTYETTTSHTCYDCFYRRYMPPVISRKDTIYTGSWRALSNQARYNICVQLLTETAAVGLFDSLRLQLESKANYCQLLGIIDLKQKIKTRSRDLRILQHKQNKASFEWKLRLLHSC